MHNCDEMCQTVPNCANLCQTVPNCAKLRRMFKLSLLWHVFAQLGRDWLSLTYFSTFTHSYAYFSTQIFSIWDSIGIFMRYPCVEKWTLAETYLPTVRFLFN